MQIQALLSVSCHAEARTIAEWEMLDMMAYSSSAARRVSESESHLICFSATISPSERRSAKWTVEKVPESRTASDL